MIDINTEIPTLKSVDFPRTKIIATIGPSINSFEKVLELLEAGANGIRVNFSHGTTEERLTQISWVRKAAKSLGRSIALIQDLQGPKIRLGDLSTIVPIEAGQVIRFRYGADYEREGALPVQYDFSKNVKRGERLYLCDGKIQTIITAVKDGIVHARVENSGILYAKKGINLPDSDFQGNILTKKDLKDIAFGVENDFDYVAQSFVQSASDIEKLRLRLLNLGSDAKIIAKIETRAALNDLEEIIATADVTMVARGDLAVETEPEIVPILQRKIISLGHKYDRPTIVATQMLASMSENPEPTRAEISDIATAVFFGADAVMLSDETASGKYPNESVRVMQKVINHVQASSGLQEIDTIQSINAHNKQGAISTAIIALANDLKATAIVAETRSGTTALKIASRRSNHPIIAITSSQRVAQQLAIVYSIKSFIKKDTHMQAQKITDWLRVHNVFKTGDIIISASGAYPGVVGATDTIKVRVIK